MSSRCPSHLTREATPRSRVSLASLAETRFVSFSEEIVAFVQLLKGTGATAQDLMAHVAPQLTSYKRPSEIILMDALPATSTGKLLKHKLAESLRK